MSKVFDYSMMSSVNDTLRPVQVAAIPDVAAIIRDTRRRHGLTQSDLAQAVGVTRQSIVNLETGRAHPSLATVLAALHALGLRLYVSAVQATQHVVTVTDDIGVTSTLDATVIPATHATRMAVGTPAPVDLDALLDAVRANDHAVNTDKDADG